MCFPEKLFSGVSSNFLHNLKGSSYCEKDYSNGEVHAVEISQTRLHKSKKKVAMTSGYYLFSKFGKKLVFVVIKRRKRLVCVVS